MKQQNYLENGPPQMLHEVKEANHKKAHIL